MEPKIFYRCDHTACEFCNMFGEGCDLTTDISHAVNFVKDELGNYVEKDSGRQMAEFIHDLTDALSEESM